MKKLKEFRQLKLSNNVFLKGVSTSTGKILYSCKLSKCTNSTEDNKKIEEKEILIIRRHQHTIRASEPRSGSERWNFSVGYNDLTLIPPAKSDCQKEGSKITPDLNIDIRAVMPDGLIIAYDKSDPSKKLWEYRFDSPVVTVWRDSKLYEGDFNENLKEINLFDSNQWDSEAEGPGLYIGMHERQLYVQENPSLNQLTAYNPMNSQLVKFPWKPHPANVLKNEFDETGKGDNEVSTATAMSVLYNSEYINGNGYYLYSSEQIQLEEIKQCNGSNNNDTPIKMVTGSMTEELIGSVDDSPVQVVVVSLWFWW